ncbi:unnamed protein product [Cunninghamella echinulata]
MPQYEYLKLYKQVGVGGNRRKKTRSLSLVNISNNITATKRGLKCLQQPTSSFSTSSSSASAFPFRIINQRKLAKLEQDANNFPQDPLKQVLLYKVNSDLNT